MVTFGAGSIQPATAARTAAGTRTSVVCHGCDYAVPALEPRPFQCPNRGDDVDHVLVRSIEGADAAPFHDNEANSLVRFRRFTHAWQTAMAIGMEDEEFVSIARRIPLVETPLYELEGVLIKDETGNLSGSHKARHLAGLIMWLEVAQRIDPSLASARLATASCGNAAMAAATIAHAVGRRLDVFVPEHAVTDELERLGANVRRCRRRDGERGDPAYLRFREAVDDGALPFTCQGPDNGLTIEGGQTLAWELAAQLSEPIDRLFVQVGGGALASAVSAGLSEAHSLGVLAKLPRIHAVQARSVAPLARAWTRVQRYDLAAAIRRRSQVMWPWETRPHSVATGIIDDETYDWVAVIRGMQQTGGWPVVVSEDELRQATRLAGGSVSATGAAGLAGLLTMRKRREIGPDERCCVLFTGVARESH